MQTEPARAPGPEVTSLWKGKRFYIVLFLFTVTFINYADRVNMSVAAQEVAKHFGWDNAMMGIVMSSFLWTYAACLIPMGWLVDRFGPRNMNASGIGIWSAAAMLTGVVSGFPSMLVARLGLGAGEATTWPACGKVIRTWFPSSERGLVTAIFQSGSNFGAAFAMPIVAWLVVTTGWRLSFVITGTIGFVWLFFWMKYYREPDFASWLPAEERAYIERERPGDAPVTADTPKVSVGKLLGQKTMLALAVSQGCMVYTQYLILTWLPSYLMQVKSMDIKKASMFSAAAFLFATVVNIAAGKLSDRLLTPDMIARGHRRRMVIFFMLLTTSVGFISLAESQALIFLLSGFAIAFSTTAIGLNIALTNDLIKDSAVSGSAFGILVFGGNVFGLLAPLLTGFIVKHTQSFDSGFFLAGALLLFGSIVNLTLTRKPIE